MNIGFSLAIVDGEDVGLHLDATLTFLAHDSVSLLVVALDDPECASALIDERPIERGEGGGGGDGVEEESACRLGVFADGAQLAVEKVKNDVSLAREACCVNPLSVLLCPVELSHSAASETLERHGVGVEVFKVGLSDEHLELIHCGGGLRVLMEEETEAYELAEVGELGAVGRLIVYGARLS